MLRFVTKILNRIKGREPEQVVSHHPKTIRVVANPDAVPLPGGPKRVAQIYDGRPDRQIIDYGSPD